LPATSKTRVPEIAYDAKSRAALTACREYLRQADVFLKADGEMPDPSGLAEARFPLSTIHKARHGKDKFWPFIAAVLHDVDAPEEERNERKFDPWYFAAMRLMELPGGRFVFDRSQGRKFYYLAYVAPQTKEGRHYLRRIIANPSPRGDVRQDKSIKSTHHDYRRITLKATSKDEVWDQLGQETRGSSKTRQDAIRFAVDLFDQQLNGTDNLLDLSREEYEQLLLKAFAVADRMHLEWERRWRATFPGQRASKSRSRTK
jgi:hypothetical protein